MCRTIVWPKAESSAGQASGIGRLGLIRFSSSSLDPKNPLSKSAGLVSIHKTSWKWTASVFGLPVAVQHKEIIDGGDVVEGGLAGQRAGFQQGKVPGGDCRSGQTNQG